MGKCSYSILRDAKRRVRISGEAEMIFLSVGGCSIAPEMLTQRFAQRSMEER
jgi:hypothetical protein